MSKLIEAIETLERSRKHKQLGREARLELYSFLESDKEKGASSSEAALVGQINKKIEEYFYHAEECTVSGWMLITETKHLGRDGMIESGLSTNYTGSLVAPWTRMGAIQAAMSMEMR